LYTTYFKINWRALAFFLKQFCANPGIVSTIGKQVLKTKENSFQSFWEIRKDFV
jgi:hypothetical protein